MRHTQRLVVACTDCGWWAAVKWAYALDATDICPECGGKNFQLDSLFTDEYWPVPK